MTRKFYMDMRCGICGLLCGAACLTLPGCFFEEIPPADFVAEVTLSTPAETTTTTTVTTTTTPMTTKKLTKRTTEEGATTATTTYTTLSTAYSQTTREKKVNLTFTKEEILKAAKISDAYLYNAYVDVENLSSNYGTVSVDRDNGEMRVPEGMGLHYISKLTVERVPKGKTITVTGTVYVRSLNTAEDGSVLGIKLESTEKFVLVKKAE